MRWNPKRSYHVEFSLVCMDHFKKKFLNNLPKTFNEHEIGGAYENPKKVV